MNKSELKPLYIKRLIAFAAEVITATLDDGCATSEAEVFELAIKHKLIKKEFAPKEWCKEHGIDHWYILQKWIREYDK